MLLMLIFPFGLFSQELPDSAIVAKLKVKKIILLRCEEGQPVDTESVYFLPRDPYREFDFSDRIILCPDSMRVLIKDEKGRTRFSGCKIDYINRSKPVRDTIGISYDEYGRKIRVKHYSTLYEYVFSVYYKYDAAGRILLVTTDAHPDRAFMRTEYVYNKAGQLLSKTEWWTMQPGQEQRDSTDYIHSKIEYGYDKNGLITEAKAYDPFHASYCPFAWTKPDEEPRVTDENVIFRYVYIY